MKRKIYSLLSPLLLIRVDVACNIRGIDHRIDINFISFIAHLLNLCYNPIRMFLFNTIRVAMLLHNVYVPPGGKLMVL